LEAALLAGGFSPDEVAVVREDQLDRAVGKSTRIIGISSGEPAGLGMNSSTMAAVAGGRIYPQAMFGRLMRKLHRLNRDGRAKIVLGGPGAWQIAGRAEARRELGVDHVVIGYAEPSAAGAFHRILRREAMPEVLAGGWQPSIPIPAMRGASTMGVVEISRGCGLGCTYCTIARAPMVHLPPETILADVRTNVAAGGTNIAAISEDFFRYGANGMEVCPDSLIGLLRAIREIPQVRLIQIDHANLVSIAKYGEEQLETVHDLLAGEDRRRWVWVNVGMETAAEELLRGLGTPAKTRRDTSESWGAFCFRQVERLCRANFFPMVSLMVALPGERDADLRETLAWVESLPDRPLAVFPLIYAPVDGAAPPDARGLRPLQWDLIRACYRRNFRWVPRLFRDNQIAAGTPWLRRTALQGMGYGQIAQWKLLLAWHRRSSRR
jgi:radical SAM superfamily enzyme YgiQ (UPF0313 family)